MKISTRGRYGLRAMVDLAQNEDTKAIPLREISERQDISEQYLEQLFASLRRAGLVRSVRGAHGGYILNRKPEEIKVGEVLEVLEGPVAPVDCVLDDDCEMTNKCVTHDLWKILSEKVNEVFETVTLADLVNQAIKE